MKILMLKDDMTTVDNFTLAKFNKGEEYDVRESTGCRLIQRGSAKLADTDRGEIYYTQHQVRE